MTTPIQRRCRVLAAVAVGAMLTSAPLANADIVEFKVTGDFITVNSELGSQGLSIGDDFVAEFLIDTDNDPDTSLKADETLATKIITGTISIFDDGTIDTIGEYDLAFNFLSVENADLDDPFNFSENDSLIAEIEDFDDVQGINVGGFVFILDTFPGFIDSICLSREFFIDFLEYPAKTRMVAIGFNLNSFSEIQVTSIHILPAPEDFDITNDQIFNFADVIAYLNLFNSARGSGTAEPLPADTSDAKLIDRLGNQDGLVSDADLLPFIEGLENAAAKTP